LHSVNLDDDIDRVEADVVGEVVPIAEGR